MTTTQQSAQQLPFDTGTVSAILIGGEWRTVTEGSVVVSDGWVYVSDIAHRIACRVEAVQAMAWALPIVFEE